MLWSGGFSAGAQLVGGPVTVHAGDTRIPCFEAALAVFCLRLNTLEQDLLGFFCISCLLFIHCVPYTALLAGHFMKMEHWLAEYLFDTPTYCEEALCEVEDYPDGVITSVPSDSETQNEISSEANPTQSAGTENASEQLHADGNGERESANESQSHQESEAHPDSVSEPGGDADSLQDEPQVNPQAGLQCEAKAESANTAEAELDADPPSMGNSSLIALPEGHPLRLTRKYLLQMKLLYKRQKASFLLTHSRAEFKKLKAEVKGKLRERCLALRCRCHCRPPLRRTQRPPERNLQANS